MDNSQPCSWPPVKCVKVSKGPQIGLLNQVFSLGFVLCKVKGGRV